MAISAEAQDGPPDADRIVRWHSTAFLNMWGDDRGKGARTFAARLPRMVGDLVAGRPEVIGLCEVTDLLEPSVTVALEATGYVKIAHSHRLSIFALPEVEKASGDFYRYPKQNKGAIEGILRQRLKIGGSWIHYGVTHLDYRDGFEEGRVQQMRQGIRAMESFARRWTLPRWRTRSVILGDLNSRRRVVEKALQPAGFKDVGAGGRIDVIAVGRGRVVLSASKQRTASDHPVVRATFGKIIVG